MFHCINCGAAECCGNVPLPKAIIKRFRKQIQRKFQKIVLENDQIHPVTADGKCIFLNKQHQCEIYMARPHICKIYGTIRELQCPYVDIDGVVRSPEEVTKVKTEIKEWVHLNFASYQEKYCSGKHYLRV